MAKSFFIAKRVLMGRINYHQKETRTRVYRLAGGDRKGVSMLPILAIMVVAAIASVGSLAIVGGTTSSSAPTGVITLVGVPNTLPQFIPMSCGHAPNETITLCRPPWTNTIELGSNADPQHPFMYSLETNGHLASRIVLTPSNMTAVVKLTIKVSTWNTSATISPFGGDINFANKSGFQTIPRAASMQSVTYFIPAHTIANATFLIAFNYALLKQYAHDGPQSVSLTFNVIDSQGRARVMYGASTDVEVIG